MKWSKQRFAKTQCHEFGGCLYMVVLQNQPTKQIVIVVRGGSTNLLGSMNPSVSRAAGVTHAWGIHVATFQILRSDGGPPEHILNMSYRLNFAWPFWKIPIQIVFTKIKNPMGSWKNNEKTSQQQRGSDLRVQRNSERSIQQLDHSRGYVVPHRVGSNGACNIRRSIPPDQQMTGK